MKRLTNVRVVMVETSHPGNIGAAARAMKNMCLERLYLVNPKAFPHADATARASGADDVLAKALVCDCLEQALDDCTLVVATSARTRSLQWPQLTPCECAERVISSREETALIFGREQSGLSNAELDLCNYMVHIPSNPEHSSLNVAAAVLVLGYELMVAAEANSPPVTEPDEPLADQQDVERFYAHLEDTLIELGFLDPANPKHLMRRLRRLFNRTRLSENEVNILRGILTATQKSVAR